MTTDTELYEMRGQMITDGHLVMIVRKGINVKNKAISKYPKVGIMKLPYNDY